MEPPATQYRRWDLQVLDQPFLGGHHVADGHHRKFQAVGLAGGRVGAGRPGGSPAAADDVRTDHPVAVGVEGLARSDHAVPPAAVAVVRVVNAGGVVVARQGVADQDGVGTRFVGLRRRSRRRCRRAPGGGPTPAPWGRRGCQSDRSTAEPVRLIFDPCSPLSTLSARSGRHCAREGLIQIGQDVFDASMPTLRRIKSGVTPAASCSSSLNCSWVVEAGWITRLLASPILARWLNSLQALDELDRRRLAAFDAETDQGALPPGQVAVLEMIGRAKIPGPG